MEAKRIFLSHKGSDKNMVLEYKEVLEEIGYKPWLDDEAMPAGTQLERGLLEGMQKSCAVIFFVTDDFVDEGFLGTEINYAVTEKREKGDEFAIITLILSTSVGEPDIESVVPNLLKQYAWKQPKSQLKALIEILRALPKNIIKDPANASTPSTNSVGRQEICPDLSENAKSVLKAAAKEDNGMVICKPTTGGVMVWAGGEYMASNDSPREAARWKAAIEELQGHHYIEETSQKGEVFQLTNAGWNMGKSLEND